MNKTIIIIGNVAAGKSTATQLLSEELGVATINADDLFQTTDPFAQDFLKDMPRWAFANEVWLTLERVKLIKKQIKKNKNRISLVDSGLLMSWVYTYSHFTKQIITKDEWQLYQNVYKELAKSVLTEISVIYLNYSLETVMSRLQKRGREYELEYYTSEYLQQVNSALQALTTQLKHDAVPLLEIKETQIKDFENNKQDAKNLINLVKQFVAA